MVLDRLVVLLSLLFFGVNGTSLNTVQITTFNVKSISTSQKSLLFQIRGGSSFPPQKQNVDKESTPNSSITATSVSIVNPRGFDFGFVPNEELFSHLGITGNTIEQGLSSSEAKQRLSQYGPNLLETPPGKSLFQCIVSQFDDRLVQILIFEVRLMC